MQKKSRFTGSGSKVDREASNVAAGEPPVDPDGWMSPTMGAES